MILRSLVLAALTALPIAVHVDTTKPVNAIRPLHAIGVGIDSDPAGEVPTAH